MTDGDCGDDAAGSLGREILRFSAIGVVVSGVDGGLSMSPWDWISLLKLRKSKSPTASASFKPISRALFVAQAPNSSAKSASWAGE